MRAGVSADVPCGPARWPSADSPGASGTDAAGPSLHLIEGVPGHSQTDQTPSPVTKDGWESPQHKGSLSLETVRRGLPPLLCYGETKSML